MLIDGCAEPSVSPSAPSTASSRAANLAGNYVLTVGIDAHCSQVATQVWVYQAALADSGGYVSVNVIGGGYTAATPVGQMYTFGDSTARFIWNFGSDDFDPSIAATGLSLYGSSDTVIRNGTMSGTIVGSASTPDDHRGCYGSHPFSLISTGN